MSKTRQFLSQFSTDFEGISTDAEINTLLSQVQISGTRNPLQKVAEITNDLRGMYNGAALKDPPPFILYWRVASGVAAIEYITANDNEKLTELKFPREELEHQAMNFLAQARSLLQKLADRIDITPQEKLHNDISTLADALANFSARIDANDACVVEGKSFAKLLTNDNFLSDCLARGAQEYFTPKHAYALQKLQAAKKSGVLKDFLGGSLAEHFANLILDAFEKHGVDIDSAIKSCTEYDIVAAKLFYEARTLERGYEAKYTLPNIDATSFGYAEFLQKIPTDSLGPKEIFHIISVTGTCMTMSGKMSGTLLNALGNAKQRLESPEIADEITTEDRRKAKDLIAEAVSVLPQKWKTLPATLSCSGGARLI